MLGVHYPVLSHPLILLMEGYNRTPAERWQTWIDDIYKSSYQRVIKNDRPLFFTPPKRCQREQRLDANVLVELRKDCTVWCGNKQIGSVSERALQKECMSAK